MLASGARQTELVAHEIGHMLGLKHTNNPCNYYCSGREMGIMHSKGHGFFCSRHAH